MFTQPAVALVHTMCFLVYLKDPHQQPRCVSVVRYTYIVSQSSLSDFFMSFLELSELSWLAKDVEVLFDLARFGCISFGISYGELELLDKFCTSTGRTTRLHTVAVLSILGYHGVPWYWWHQQHFFFLKSLCGYFWPWGTPTDSVELLTAYPVGDTYRFWPSENGLAKNGSSVAEYAHRTPRHLYFHWSKTCS